MSRVNKVNPDHYTQAGRLTPDDLARSRWEKHDFGSTRRPRGKPLPPWMQGTPSDGSAGSQEGSDAAVPTAGKAAAPRRRGPRQAAVGHAIGSPKETNRQPASRTRRGAGAKPSPSTRARKTPVRRGAKPKPGSTVRPRTGATKPSPRTTAASRAGGAPRATRTLTEKKPKNRKRQRR